MGPAWDATERISADLSIDTGNTDADDAAAAIDAAIRRDKPLLSPVSLVSLDVL